jgi:hypothetical protein
VNRGAFGSQPPFPPDNWPLSGAAEPPEAAHSAEAVSMEQAFPHRSQEESMSETGTLISYNGKITREELARVPTPPGTTTHRPVPHHEIVEALVETLSFRQIAVVKDEYAVTKDGMKMFGILDLATGFEGCRFSIGPRNSHDKSFRLAATVGVRVVVCENMAFSGDFTPILA